MSINDKYYKIKNIEIETRTTTSYDIQITNANAKYYAIIIVHYESKWTYEDDNNRCA